MTGNKSLIVGIAAAGLSFAAALAVYAVARDNLPELLSALGLFQQHSISPNWFFGSAPSFFYTLSFCLLLGICLPTPEAARWHCMGWASLALLLEFSQVAVIAAAISGALPSILPGAAGLLIAPYWEHGVFDWLDIVATAVGGGLALLSIEYLPARSRHESVH